MESRIERIIKEIESSNVFAWIGLIISVLGVISAIKSKELIDELKKLK